MLPTTPTAHCPGCCWAAAEKEPRVKIALAWHRHLCERLSEQAAHQRENYVRVVDLLGITIQAAANPALLEWLLTALRGSIEQPHPDAEITKASMGFATKFASVMAAPPEHQQLSSLPAAAGVAGAFDHTSAWTFTLFRLLVRLQTNLFYLDDLTIGIYPSCWLFEHSCRPNAKLTNSSSPAADRGLLQLTALAPIAKGAPITFCYTDLDPGKRDLLDEDFGSRRYRLERELGFVCCCEACAEQEAALMRSNPRVFLDISIGAEAAGRIELLLRADVAPRTSENFRCLCTGEKGASSPSRRRLHYEGTLLHRIIPKWCIQGSAGNDSIYGGPFRDETFKLSHDRPGVLSMANSGPDSNTAGFFITCAPARENDGRHVAFGEVVRGMDVVRAVEAVGSASGTPTKPVTIDRCGQLS